MNNKRYKLQLSIAFVSVILVIIFMYILRSIFTPLFISFGLAFIFKPMIDGLERKGISRTRSILGLFLLIFAISTLMFMILVPQISQDVATYGAKIKENIRDGVGEKYSKILVNVLDYVDEKNSAEKDNKDKSVDEEEDNDRDGDDSSKENDPTKSGNDDQTIVDPKDDGKDGGTKKDSEVDNDQKAESAESDPEQAKGDAEGAEGDSIGLFERLFSSAKQYVKENFTMEYVENTFKKGFDFVMIILSSAQSILYIILILLLIPVYTFFILKESNNVRDITYEHLPNDYRSKIIDVLGKINRTIADFLRGRLIVCTIVFVISWIGFVICGLPFAFLFALILSIAILIPLLPFVLIIPLILLSYMTGGQWPQIIGVTSIIIGLTVLDGVFFTPVIMGKEVHMHPVTLILSVIICGELMGLFGILLAIPIVSTAKILFLEFILPHVKELAGKNVKLAESTDGESVGTINEGESNNPESEPTGSK